MAMLRWSNEAVQTLNEVCGHGDSAGAVRPSFAQRSRNASIVESVRRFGPPPELPAAGALSELCGTHPSGYGGGRKGAVAYERDLVSLPAVAGTLKEPLRLLGPRDRRLWADWQEQLLNSPEETASALRELGVVEPYTDAVLKGRRKAMPASSLTCGGRA